MALALKRRPVDDRGLGLLVVCDVESTGTHAWTGDRPFMIGFCGAEGQTLAIEFPVDPLTRRVKFEERPEDYAWLKRYLGDPRVVKIGWNAKFDQQMCAESGFPWVGTCYDAMHLMHCCYSSEPSYALKPSAKKWVHMDDADEVELQQAVVKLRRKAKARGWKLAEDVEADYWLTFYAEELLDDPEEAAHVRALCEVYCVGDCERAMLMWVFFQGVCDELGTRPVFDDETALAPITYAMEERGIRVDPVELRRARDGYQKEYDFYAKQVDAVGLAAKKAGSLDTVLEGTVTQLDRLKRGDVRRVRILGDNGKELWFNTRQCTFSQDIDGVEVGDRLEARRPFPDHAEFNVDSPDQLAAVLYDHLGLNVELNEYQKKKRKTDYTRSTDMTTLLEMSGSHDFPEWILKCRSLSKAVDFFTKYERYAVKTGAYWVLKPEFQQCGPKTGRYACRHPNIQQTPTRNASRAPFPVDGRSPFGPRPGHIWYCIDYSQLEVRIFAALSGERKMLDIIRSGSHIHKACADHVWGYREGKPTTAAIASAIHTLGFGREGESTDFEAIAALRTKFKGLSHEMAAERWLDSFQGSIVAAEASINRKNAVNKAKLMIFTRIFGGGLPSIMNLLRCSREDAKQFLDEYGSAFPDMDPWIKRITREAAHEGCVWTAYGRRIDIPDRDKAYRAVNNKVQGSAADLLKRAMRQSNAYLRDNDVDGWLVLSIHDELVFEFDMRKPRMEHVLQLKRCMEDHGGVFNLAMPTEVECVKKRWCDKEKVSWANAK